MESTRAVGIAGYIYVSPIALAGIAFAYWVFFRAAPAEFAFIQEGLNVDLFPAKLIVTVVAAMVALFVALPGLLLVTIAEAGEQRERTNRLLSEISGKLTGVNTNVPLTEQTNARLAEISQKLDSR